MPASPCAPALQPSVSDFIGHVLFNLDEAPDTVTPGGELIPFRDMVTTARVLSALFPAARGEVGFLTLPPWLTAAAAADAGGR